MLRNICWPVCTLSHLLMPWRFELVAWRKISTGSLELQSWTFLPHCHPSATSLDHFRTLVPVWKRPWCLMQAEKFCSSVSAPSCDIAWTFSVLMTCLTHLLVLHYKGFLSLISLMVKPKYYCLTIECVYGLKYFSSMLLPLFCGNWVHSQRTKVASVGG